MLVVGGAGVPATVDRVDFFGQDTRLALRLDNNLEIIARIRSSERMRRGSQTTVAHDGRPLIAWKEGASSSSLR